LVGTALAVGCSVEVNDGDGDDTTQAGAGADSGGSSGSGGKGGSGGTGGTSAGKGGAAGTGGTSAGKGGAAGSGGSGQSGTSGSTSEAGQGGSGEEIDTTPECDPDSGQLDNTPWPNCEPTDSENECEVCIQQNCCEESQECFSHSPGNVCGWGGPEADDGSRMGEAVCYQSCVRDYVEGEGEGVCDVEAEDTCIGDCTTEECGQLGNQTQDLVACMWESCAMDCFSTPDPCE
jgi:hypothetical protein